VDKFEPVVDFVDVRTEERHEEERGIGEKPYPNDGGECSLASRLESETGAEAERDDIANCGGQMNAVIADAALIALEDESGVKRDERAPVALVQGC
jgi:hypothetical protein